MYRGHGCQLPSSLRRLQATPLLQNSLYLITINLNSQRFLLSSITFLNMVLIGLMIGGISVINHERAHGIKKPINESSFPQFFSFNFSQFARWKSNQNKYSLKNSFVHILRIVRLLCTYKNKNVVYAASSLHLVTNKYPLGLLARVVDAS